MTKSASVSDAAMFGMMYGVGKMVAFGRRRNLYSKG